MTKIYIDLTKDEESLEIKGITTCCPFMSKSIFDTGLVTVKGSTYRDAIFPKITMKIESDAEYLNEHILHKGLPINYCPICGTKTSIWDIISQKEIITEKGITIRNVLKTRK